MRLPCPLENESCKYYESATGCFSDQDHIVPQRFRGISWIINKYIDTPENKQQLCRAEHDEKTLTESVDDIPPYQDMAQPILDAHHRGDIRLDSSQRYILEKLING